MSFLLVPQTQEAPDLVEQVEPLQFSITLSGPGLATLRTQLERDINAKGFGLNPIPFRLLELLDMERFVRFHTDGMIIEPGDNILITEDQAKQLFVYANRYFIRAVESEDQVQKRVYIDLVQALSAGATLLTQEYSSETLIGYEYHRLLPDARPLHLLWGLVCAVFGGRNRPQFYDSLVSTPQAISPLAMTVQDIINTGEVDEYLDTELLEEASARLDRLVRGIEESNWGPIGEAAVKKYQAVSGKILDILNSRHGMDGMTPLSS